MDKNSVWPNEFGIFRVIAYGSRTLTPVEKNYHLHSGKLEFFALKWAICGQFRDYLYHSHSFVVYTDNNPLTHVLSSAKLNATGLRWIGELADFNFTIRYRPGKTNTDALRRLLKMNCMLSYSRQRSKAKEELTGFLPSHTIQTY